MKVVIALDHSPKSQHMLDLICRRHWAPDTQFKIVHVVEPLDPNEASGNGWMELQQNLIHRRHLHAEKLCCDARSRLASHVPASIVHYEVREGDPDTQIIFSATEWDANKIIIGSCSRDVCPHNQLGSVSRAVAERSSCSVEIIRSHPARQHSKTAAKATK